MKNKTYLDPCRHQLNAILFSYCISAFLKATKSRKRISTCPRHNFTIFIVFSEFERKFTVVVVGLKCYFFKWIYHDHPPKEK